MYNIWEVPRNLPRRKYLCCTNNNKIECKGTFNPKPQKKSLKTLMLEIVKFEEKLFWRKTKIIRKFVYFYF